MRRAMKILWRTLLLSLLLACAGAGSAGAAVKQIAAGKTSITIKWDTPSDLLPTETLLNFKVQLNKASDGSKNLKTVATLDASARSCEITGLKAGTKYNVMVYYDLYGKNHLTVAPNEPPSTRLVGYQWGVGTLPANVTGLRLKSWSPAVKKMKVTWTRQTGADGYEYLCRKSNGATFKKGTVTGGKTYVILSKVKDTMCYSFHVRAYTTIGGKKYYGAWTSPLWCCAQPQITKAKVSGKKLSVKWKKVSGATSYAVYVSTKPKSGYKLTMTLPGSKKSAVLKKFKGKKFKNSAVYYVYVRALKSVDGKTFSSKKIRYWNTRNKKYANF